MADNSNRSPTAIVGEFFQDNDGNYSATRLAFLIWSIGVLAVWSFVSLRSGELKGLPPDIATVLGVLMTGKVVQKFAENAQDNATAAAGQRALARPAITSIAQDNVATAASAG